jgi:creatinine amidohydrolase
MTTKVEYELMRPDEVVRALVACPIAFVPIGPLEWHGPHLPLGTDPLHAHHVAVAAARRLGGVVLPALFAGTETLVPPGNGAQQRGSLGFQGDERIIGMDFPGNPVKSLYFEESAFGITVRAVVRGLKLTSARVIVLLNGHGAVNHQRALERIAHEETEAGVVRVLYLSAWAPPVSPQRGPGHADRWETAIAFAVAEQHVALARLPARDRPLPYKDFGIVDGLAFDGHPSPGFAVPEHADPRLADRAEGERIIAEEIDWIAGQMKSLAIHPDGRGMAAERAPVPTKEDGDQGGPRSLTEGKSQGYIDR